MLSKTVMATYLAFAAFVYTGFLFHSSADPFVLWYSLRYWVFLVVLLMALSIPCFVPQLQRRIGTAGLLYTLVPSFLVFFLVYLLAGTVYYHTRTHPFDPFLQAPPVPIDFQPAQGTGNVYRIIAIGGSTTRNARLKKEQRYPKVLEGILQRKYPEEGVQVLNLGMDWWTTKHSLINYVTNVRDTQPDLVIVMHAINDLFRSFSPQDYAMGEYNPLWSHFYGPSINGAKPPSFTKYLKDRYLRGILRKWYFHYRFAEVDYPVNRYLSLEQFERNLRRLIHYLKSDHVNLIFLTQPSLFKENMTSEEREVLWFGPRFCVTDIDWIRSEYPSPSSLQRAMKAFNSVTRRVAEEAHIPLVDLAETVPKTLEYFLDDVHYSLKGGTLVARLVAETVETSGLIELRGSERRGLQ